MAIPANDGIIAQEGLPFIGGGLVLALALTGLASSLSSLVAPLAGVAWAFVFFCTWFFRNPERRSDAADAVVISPADGRVLQVMELPHDEWVGGPVWKISIFMSVFDVHVNRSPVSGRVDAVDYRPGKFFNASVDKASSENEQSSMSMTHDSGQRLRVVQIAGLVARRILNYAQPGDVLARGRRYGVIRFGSRVELFLPADCKPLVKVGERTVAGETPLAELGER